jgi:RNA polymerase sigma-70 factor (ECF subfamily)
MAPPGGLEQADLEQMVRERLLVAPPGAAARITEYAGRGPLRLWLRVVVLRLMQNLAVRGPREALLDGAALAEHAGATGDPELERLRSLYRGEVRAAFAAAAAALEQRDRVLLHQRFAGRMSQEALAGAYEVHVNTVARWLERARRALAEGVRRELELRLGAGGADLESVLKLVDSQLDLTLGRLVGG